MKSIKGELIGDLSDFEIENYLSWCYKLLHDTVIHNKDLDLLREQRQYTKEGNLEEINRIKKKRKSIEPKNYPKNLTIGDIVYL